MPVRVLSLRHRLLSSSILAVLSGYGVLLIAFTLIASHDRREAHRTLVGSVLQILQSQEGGILPLPAMSRRLAQLVSPGLLVWVETDQGVPYRPANPSGDFPIPAGSTLPRLLVQAGMADGGASGAAPAGLAAVAAVTAGDHTYLTSSVWLRDNGRRGRIRFLQDVTAQVERQRTSTLLLTVAAGLSTLFTGLLLRPVLHRGLAPLRRLGAMMQGIGSDTLDRSRVPLDEQPAELAPIATAFNELLDRLSASWERQRAFVNGVSHELRTPIALIGSYAARLRRRGQGLGERDREAVALIEAEADRMARLVADLLELARLEAGQRIASCAAFDLTLALEQVVRRLQSRCDGRLVLEPAAVKPALAQGDAERFEQCLGNLVENAFKYSPAASPIRLRLDAEPGQWLVHVLDVGPGVPDDEKQRIFERFQRGSRTAAVPGSGIGLAVVRSLMQAMGGSVAVADAPGGGADFQLRLGRAPRPPAA